MFQHLKIKIVTLYNLNFDLISLLSPIAAQWAATSTPSSCGPRESRTRSCSTSWHSCRPSSQSPPTSATSSQSMQIRRFFPININLLILPASIAVETSSDSSCCCWIRWKNFFSSVSVSKLSRSALTLEESVDNSYLGKLCWIGLLCNWNILRKPTKRCS